MRVLFCNYSFPGRLAPLASWLAAQSDNEVLFASCFERRNFKIAGVRQVYTKLKSLKNTAGISQDPYLNDMSGAIRIGRKMQSTLTYLRDSGFIPDIILYSSMNGPALFLEQVYPDSFRIAYLDEILLRTTAGHGSDVQFASDLIAIHSASANLCYAFTDKQINRCPGRLGELYRVIPPAVDDIFFSRDQAQPFKAGLSFFSYGNAMLSIAAKDEKSISSRELWIILIEFLQIKNNAHICFCTPKETVMHLIIRIMQRLPQQFRDRIHVSGFLRLEDYRNMLCASSVRLYLSETAVAPDEFLEAAACGAFVLNSAPIAPNDSISALFLKWSGTRSDRLSLLVNAFDHASAGKCDNNPITPAFFPGPYNYEAILPNHFAEIEKEYVKWADVNGSAR